jgi:large subunit ribosomal protein L30
MTPMTTTRTIRVTLTGSPIGTTPRQRQTLRGLGLTRVGRSVVLHAHPAVVGMVAKVAHLVRVKEEA